MQNGVHAIAQRAASVPGITVPQGWNPFADPNLVERQVAWLRRAAVAVDGSAPFHVALRKLLVAGETADPVGTAKVTRLRTALLWLLEVCRSTSPALAQWAGDDGFVLRWTMTRPERGVEHPGLMSLRRWVSFLDTLEPLRTAGLIEARHLLVTGTVHADDAVRAFDRGVATASGEERGDATGRDTFDPEFHEKAIRRFTAASQAVRRHLTSALPAAVEGDQAVRDRPVGTGLANVLRHARTPEDLDSVAALLTGPPIGLDVLDETFTEYWTAATSAIQGEVAAYIAFRHPAMDVATPEALDLPLAEIYVAAQTAAAAGFFSRRRKRFAVRDRLAPYLRPGAQVKPKEVPALV